LEAEGRDNVKKRERERKKKFQKKQTEMSGI
jgi:hypothetical protein